MPGILVLLGLGLLVLWAGCVAYTAWMLTHPPRRTYASAVSRGRPGDPSELERPREFESWTLETRGRRLPVWSIRGDLAAGPTVILTHGWADSRIGALARVGALASGASRVIAWDLPGHGEATGVCRLGLAEQADLLALIERVDDGSPLLLYGWSLGAGLSIVAAVERPGVAGVMAESPYRLAATPARNVLRARRLPWRATLPPALAAVGWSVGDAAFRGFDRAAWAARLPCPLLVLHGAGDLVCPVEDGRAIAAAAPRGRIVEIAGAGHNDLWTDPRFAEDCAAAIRAFVSEVAAPRLRA